MNSQNIVVKRMIVSIMVLFSFAATITKILTGFDIDEAYALALPYRVLQGDRLFADMWEVHQTSWHMPYLFMKLYSFFMPSMEYVVVYMRIIATLIHFVLGVFVYYSIKKVLISYGQSKNFAMYLSAIAALIYYNFLPKWMMNLDFSMMELWFFTLFIIFLLKGMESFEKKYKIDFFLAGLMLAIGVLAYPGMVLLYPATVILVFLNKKEAKKSLWKAVGAFTIGCAAAALIFFIGIFRYMSLSEFMAAVPKVFMDGSHQYDLGTKLSQYCSQWLEVGRQTIILSVPALAVAVVVYLLKPLLPLNFKIEKKDFFFLFCLLFEIEVSLLIGFAGLFTTWGPFRLQVRYIIQFVMAFILLYGYKKKKDEMTHVWWLSFVAFLGVLIASNVGPTSSASYLVVGNMLFVVLTVLLVAGKNKLLQILAHAGALLFLFSLITCKGYYMRNTEYVPGDIGDGLVQIQEGPLSGIYVKKQDQIRLTGDYHTIRDCTTDTDRVLFLGTESLCNLYAKGKIVSPTTISTPAFNEQWVEYFELHPDKEPTIIFLSKNTIDNREKFFAKNPFGIWIGKYYDVECMEETDSLCIIRQKEK